MTNPLLMLDIHIEVANHHDAAIGTYALFPSAELTGLHVPLHDVHAILLVKGDSRDFIEADHIILAD